MSTLRVANLSLRLELAKHGQQRILCRDLNVEFNTNQNWAILGANGIGKSTLLEALAGLRMADEGKIFLDNAELNSISTWQRAKKIGLLLQHEDTVFPATVLETVLTGRHPYSGNSVWQQLWQWENEEDVAIAGNALDQLGLANLQRRNITTLSGGERRRVEIAALLAQNPSIALLDEPINHLDINFQNKIMDRLIQRDKQGNVINIFVLHDINVALRYCQYGILLFENGHSQTGLLADIINLEILERLYHCPFQEVTGGKNNFFLPA